MDADVAGWPVDMNTVGIEFSAGGFHAAVLNDGVGDVVEKQCVSRRVVYPKVIEQHTRYVGQMDAKNP